MPAKVVVGDLGPSAQPLARPQHPRTGLAAAYLATWPF